MKKTKLILNLLISATALLGSFSAIAEDGAALYAAKGCMACHGADAKTSIMPAYPNLAGQNAEYMLAQMIDIKSGARNNGQTAVMKGIVAGITDEELGVLAKYIAGLPE